LRRAEWCSEKNFAVQNLQLATLFSGTAAGLLLAGWLAERLRIADSDIQQ